MDIKRIILEEINDFDWIKDSKPTLGELFNSNILKNGDIIYLRGNVHHGNESHGFMYVDKLVLRWIGDEFVNHIGPQEVNDWLGIEDISHKYLMTKKDMDSLVVLDIKKKSNWWDKLNEQDDFDWIKALPGDRFDVDTTEDYVDIWPIFEKFFMDEGIWIESGKVKSSDYDGAFYIEVRTNKGDDITITMHMDYDESRGDSLITYYIYLDDRLKSNNEYYPPKEHWTTPTLDGLRILTNKLKKYS